MLIPGEARLASAPKIEGDAGRDERNQYGPNATMIER